MWFHAGCSLTVMRIAWARGAKEQLQMVTPEAEARNRAYGGAPQTGEQPARQDRLHPGSRVAFARSIRFPGGAA